MSPIARRGAVLAVLTIIILVVAGAAGAAAHPLGNFTVNTYSGLRVGPDRLDVDHVVDLAEIPTFQTRQAIDTDRDDRVADAEAGRWRDRECRRLAAGLEARVNGRAARLAVTGSALRFPEGVGGLPTLRLECALSTPLPAGARTLTYADGSYEDRVGWREITAVGDRVTLDTTDVPPPARAPASPGTRRTSSAPPSASAPRPFTSAPAAPRAPAAAQPARGNPTSGCEAPRRGSLADLETGCSGLSTGPTSGGVDRATAALAALVGERSGSAGFAVVALVVAVGLGAAHALAPGHGKTVMAAYLVGLRGSLRQAATIGATVTLTHTAGVLLLGLVLSTTRAVASERVYPGWAWAAASSSPGSGSPSCSAPAPAAGASTIRPMAMPTTGTATTTATAITMGTATATTTATTTGMGMAGRPSAAAG